MVVIKGGGTTYSISNGRQVEWDDVPESFKKKMAEQSEIEKCVDMRARAQECIEDKGFWAPGCIGLTESFHLCQANELTRTQLPTRQQLEQRHLQQQQQQQHK